MRLLWSHGYLLNCCDSCPGLEQEREPDWVMKSHHFHGYKVRQPPGSIYLGPFRMSERLLSQYIATHSQQVVLLNQEQLSNVSQTMQEYAPFIVLDPCLARGFFCEVLDKFRLMGLMSLTF